MSTAHEVQRLLEEDDFSLWVPPTETSGFTLLAKAGEVPTDDAPRIIHGFCTTEDEDRQQEIVIAKGLDFAPFIKHGWFNDNHSPRTADVLGWPTEARLYEDKGWYTKGQLLKGKKAADDVWELAVALFKSGSPRRLGFSIEGKATLRNAANRIIKGVVRHVAITRDPVNPNCQLDVLCKAFASPDEIERAYALTKAATVGHQHPAMRGHATLVPSDLEAVRVIKRKKHLSKSDVERLVRREMQMSDASVTRVVNWIMSQQQ